MKPFELKERLDKVGIDHTDVRRVCWYVAHEDAPYWYRWLNDTYPREIDFHHEFCVELYEPINGCPFVVVLEKRWSKPEVHYYAFEPKKVLAKQIHRSEKKRYVPKIKRKKTVKKGYGRRHLREDKECGC